MNKLLVLLGIFFLAIIAGCSQADNTSAPVVDEVVPQEDTTSSDDSAPQEDLPTTTDNTASSDDEMLVVEVDGFNFGYSESEIRAKAGQKVKIIFTNTGGTHDLVVEGTEFRTPIISTGETSELEFTIDEAGEYAFYCSVGSHRAAGMEGKIIIE